MEGSTTTPDKFIKIDIPDIEPSITIHRNIDSLQLSHINDTNKYNCIRIDCANMAILIKKIKTIYNSDVVMKLINLIRTFINNIILLHNDITNNSPNILSLLDKLSKNLKEYNKLIKMPTYKIKMYSMFDKIKTFSKSSNYYSELYNKYKKITNEDAKKKFINAHKFKICNFNQKILETIYININNLLNDYITHNIKLIQGDTKKNPEETKQEVQIKILNYDKKGTNIPDNILDDEFISKHMIDAKITHINYQNKSFRYEYIDSNNTSHTSDSYFIHLCPYNNTGCFNPDSVPQLIGPKSVPPHIPLSDCSQTHTQSKQSVNSSSRSKIGEFALAALSLAGNVVKALQ